MNDHVHSLLEGRDRYRRVGVVRRHHLHRGNILLFVKELSEIRIGGTSLELVPSTVLRIVGFHNLLADIAPTRHAIVAFAPGRILNQPPNVIPDLAVAPFEVVSAVFLDVANRHELDVRARENTANLPNRLRTEADAGQSYLLAWRD